LPILDKYLPKPGLFLCEFEIHLLTNNLKTNTMIKYEDPPGSDPVSRVPGKNKNYDSRTILGVILVLIGSVLIARNYGWLDYEFSRVLIIGLFNLARGAYTPAVVLSAIGLFFLIDIPYSLRENLWPALIVLVGITLILQWRRSPGSYKYHLKAEQNGKSTDFIDETAIFGGKTISVVSENFQGGKITSIFGGSKINLLYAKPVPGCTIDVANIFGGTKIMVPEDWNIKVEVASIFGGFDDKRSASVISRTGSGKIVVIKGTCIFGGGEVTTMP
jgi:predicted membrane protein